jgi:hypothetical protein
MMAAEQSVYEVFMSDSTVARRVAAYRNRQSTELGFERAEARIAVRDRPVLQRLAADLRRHRLASKNNAWLNLALGTLNAPRPLAIDADILLDCLLAERAESIWRPHLEAFFTELSVELLHRLVLEGICSFEDLRRAQRVWGPFRGERYDWIDDMAGLALERDAVRYSTDFGGAQTRQ